MAGALPRLPERSTAAAGTKVQRFSFVKVSRISVSCYGCLKHSVSPSECPDCGTLRPQRFPLRRIHLQKPWCSCVLSAVCMCMVLQAPPDVVRVLILVQAQQRWGCLARLCQLSLLTCDHSQQTAFEFAQAGAAGVLLGMTPCVHLGEGLGPWLHIQ